MVSNWPDSNWWVKFPGSNYWTSAATWPTAMALAARWHNTGVAP